MHIRNFVTAPARRAKSALAVRLYKLLRPSEVWQGEPKTVLFLVGPGHTGSTLLNFILGSHSRVFGAGELSKLETRKWIERHTSPASMCAVCLDCDFWPGVIEAHSYQDIYLRLFALLDIDVVVDSSKDVSWAARQRSIGRGVGYKYVELVRDGRGCVASYKRKGQPIEYSVERWRREELRTVDFFRSLDPFVYVTVKYEALASDPESTVAELCDFLGIEFDPEMIEYWKKKHHALGGNAGTKTAVRLYHDIAIANPRSDIEMYKEKGCQIFLDERWKQELTAQDKELFERVAGDLNRTNGYDT